MRPNTAYACRLTMPKIVVSQTWCPYACFGLDLLLLLPAFNPLLSRLRRRPNPMSQPSRQ
jgi:hypothetical protein